MAAAHEKHPPAWRHYAVWIALACLTGATFGFYHVPLGRASVLVALGIAAIKAALVALFFMELWEHRGVSRLVFVVPVLFVAALTVLAIADAATRFPPAVPSGAQGAPPTDPAVAPPLPPAPVPPR
jgi:cytochrome c oxidase subunit 4